MDAYNLIGTLITLEPTKPIYDAIRNATVKHQPKSDFIVITSQVVHPGHRAALNAVIKDRFTQCQGIIYTDPKHKITLLARHNVTSYTDSDDETLETIQRKQPNLKLYKITPNRARILVNG